MTTRTARALTIVVCLAGALEARAEPVAVRFAEGIVRGFPVLRAASGDLLAHGELVQVPRGDLVESRLVFRFGDGSVYDETVVFSQRGVFQLERYRVWQEGASFPETVEASIDRASRQFRVRYRADSESPEEHLSGSFELPPDVYSGMLGTLLKNLPAGQSHRVQVLVFTPKPRLVTVMLAPVADDTLTISGRPLVTTRYLIKPQLGLLASLLVADLAPLECWVVGGDAPTLVRFQGPLYFMGPVWSIELN